MRVEFFALLSQMTAMRASVLNTAERQTAFEEVMVKIYFEKYPRRRARPKMEKIQKDMPEIFEKVAQGHVAEYDKAYKAYKVFEGETKETLETLAEGLEIAATDTSVVFRTTDEWTYSTQGWGARSYARNAAEMEQFHVEHCGVRGDVVERVRKLGARNFSEFDVLVYCSEEDLPLLRYKKGPPLRAMVQLCWKKGRNPRVHMPFLPHGYEESVGLDFFGNSK